MTANRPLNSSQLKHFHEEGYLVLKGFLSRGEAAEWRDHFMEMHAQGPVEGFFNPLSLEEAHGDMLRAYPRILLPHRWDKTSERYLLDPRLEGVLRDLLEDEPLAAQSMFYFKPPGARGQAMHQDDFYLRTAPGNCLAAWFSLDDTDSNNGGLSVVPGSHREPVLCPHAADLRTSFTIEEVDVPGGLAPVQVDLQQGDVLFFNGRMIHGSEPNTTAGRFRRSFICHYVPRSTEEISSWYKPLLTFGREEVTREGNDDIGGGPCGTDELAALRAGVLAQGELARVGLEQNAIALP